MSGKRVLRLSEMEQKTPAISPVEAMRRQLQVALFGAVKESDVLQMVEKLKSMALEGDLRAMKLFFSLVVGQGSQQPAPPVSVQQAVVVQEPERPAEEPTIARPKTDEKLLVFQERAARGESLFHPADAGCAQEDE